uniref:Uncharacterized protein n=1 Tax=Oreochromis aureus TaxID=47969 RepID=A0A668TKV0_OREAU
ISPISNTVEIFVTGLDAASLSFLASNFGLNSSTGNLYANDGISFSSSFFPSFFSSSLLFNSIWCMMFSLEENIWKRTASHICVALGVSLVSFSFWPVSGNLGSSCSTTMCFLSLDQPLALDFIPFGFNMALRRDSPAGRLSSLSFFSSPGDVVIITAGVIEVLGSSDPVELFLLDSSGSDFDFVILGCIGFAEGIVSEWMSPFSVCSRGTVVFTLWEADELLTTV